MFMQNQVIDAKGLYGAEGCYTADFAGLCRQWYQRQLLETSG